MSQYFTQAIYTLYPQTTHTISEKAYDKDDNIVEYDAVAVEVEANKIACKNQATVILSSTDWTSITDVGNPDMANPYLVNQADFIAYRSTVRNYAVNPVVDPVWPTQPTEQWSS